MAHETFNNVITFEGKVIGYTNDNFTPEELDTMSHSGIQIYSDICGTYINLLTGEKLVSVA